MYALQHIHPTRAPRYNIHTPHHNASTYTHHSTCMHYNTLRSSLSMHALQHIYTHSTCMHYPPPPNHSPLSPIIQHPLITSTYTRFRNSLNATKRTLRAALCEAALTQHCNTFTPHYNASTYITQHACTTTFIQLHETLLLLLLIILLLVFLLHTTPTYHFNLHSHFPTLQTPLNTLFGLLYDEHFAPLESGKRTERAHFRSALLSP